MVSVLAFYMRILVRISLKSTICVKLLVNNKNREKETGIVVIKKCLILGTPARAPTRETAAGSQNDGPPRRGVAQLGPQKRCSPRAFFGRVWL